MYRVILKIQVKDENKEVLKAFCNLEQKLKEVEHGDGDLIRSPSLKDVLNEKNNLFKKVKSLEFDVERLRSVKMKSELKIQALEQKIFEVEDNKKQLDTELSKKIKNLEFEVERCKSVKLKNDLKVQALEQKVTEVEDGKKQIEQDLKNDDVKKKDLLEKTHKVL